MSAVVASLLLLLACTGSETPTVQEVQLPASPADPAPLAPGVLPISKGTVAMITVKDAGIPVPGRFEQVKGSISLDPANLGQSKGSLTIPLASWNSDLELRDQRVKETFLQVGTVADPSFELQGIDGASAALVGDGASAIGTARGLLRWGSTEQAITAPVRIERLPGGSYRVQVEEFKISIASLGLEEQKGFLMDLCMHDDLADEVAVRLDLTLGAGQGG
jgi:hypothetical protein